MASLLALTLHEMRDSVKHDRLNDFSLEFQAKLVLVNSQRKTYGYGKTHGLLPMFLFLVHRLLSIFDMIFLEEVMLKERTLVVASLSAALRKGQS